MKILIDDDKIMHLSWKLKASKANYEIKCYFQIEDFLSDVSIDKNAAIFIDSDLGNGTKGEIESKRIYDLGFHNIYLTTGHTDIDSNKHPWLKGIISKTPPF